MSFPPRIPHPWMTRDFDDDAEWCGQCDGPGLCPACGDPLDSRAAQEYVPPRHSQTLSGGFQHGEPRSGG